MDPFKLESCGLKESMETYMREMGYKSLLQSWNDIFLHREGVFKYSTLLGKGVEKQNSSVGQLSRKLEAAGKVRVFAMVDIWTQTILKPLHNMLSAFLASLPNDGTKDQVAS